MSIILSHPTGNEFVRAAARGMQEAGVLHTYYTTLASTPGSLLSAIGKGPLSEINRRAYSATIASFIRTQPWYEAGRMIATKAGLRRLTRHETGIFSVDSVYRKMDTYVSRRLATAREAGATAMYSYEDGALETFRKAKAMGLTCLYDLPIGYWRAMHRLLLSERENRPEWAATLTGFNDSATKLARKDEELRLADHIFVASSFTAATLKEYPGSLAPVSIIPYGFPTPVAARQYQPLHNRPLKLLFVGGLSQRKGIANLFEAVESFGKRVELTVAGNKPVPDCNALNTALTRHRWIPTLPHAEILQLMQQHDVLVFPSLFEGFGLVITEAMSQGTPVITTERTAGPDIIRHGENGWITEAGDTAQLKEMIAAILNQPALLQQVGKAAMETARLRPWSVYGAEVVEEILKIHSQ